VGVRGGRVPFVFRSPGQVGILDFFVCNGLNLPMALVKTNAKDSSGFKSTAAFARHAGKVVESEVLLPILDRLSSFYSEVFQRLLLRTHSDTQK
jgi:hypothetical protein